MQDYQINAQHYYENSQETLEKKEFGKSGELLWGSIAEMCKAVYLHSTGEPMNSHMQIRDFLKGLFNTYRKKELKDWANSANLLHVNFYETFLDEHCFMEHYSKGVKLYVFLMNKLHSQKKEQKK